MRPDYKRIYWVCPVCASENNQDERQVNQPHAKCDHCEHESEWEDTHWTIVGS
jgi:hypothetical protein